MEWKRIIAVRYVKDLLLEITFNNGVSGEIDFSEVANEGVLMSFLNPSFFKNFAIVRNGRAIEWEGGLDFCADSLYEQVVQQPFENLSLANSAANK